MILRSLSPLLSIHVIAFNDGKQGTNLFEADTEKFKKLSSLLSKTIATMFHWL